jgi:hypothetical protein
VQLEFEIEEKREHPCREQKRRREWHPAHPARLFIRRHALPDEAGDNHDSGCQAAKK